MDWINSLIMESSGRLLWSRLWTFRNHRG